MIRKILLVLSLVLLVIGFSQTQAFATHTSPSLPSSTVVVQNMTPSSSLSPHLTSRVQYYNGIPGKPVYMVQGTCQPGFVCFRVWIQDSGATGTDGTYQDPAMCGSDFCTWPTSSAIIVLNTHYTHTSTEWDSLVCHEYGHGWQEQHDNDAGCMNPNNLLYIHLSAGSTGDELELYAVYHGVARSTPSRTSVITSRPGAVEAHRHLWIELAGKSRNLYQFAG